MKMRKKALKWNKEMENQKWSIDEEHIYHQVGIKLFPLLIVLYFQLEHKSKVFDCLVRQNNLLTDLALILIMHHWLVLKYCDSEKFSGEKEREIPEHGLKFFVN